jgi:hypothetical protein
MLCYNKQHCGEKMNDNNKQIVMDNVFSRMYPFTTENITGYIEAFTLKNKSLLTVGSSLDQTINSVMYGCKDITVIDICPNVKQFYYLKVAALLSLSYEEYMNFILKDEAFNLVNFKKVKDVLKIINSEAYYFWADLFLRNNAREIRNHYFFPTCQFLRILKAKNPYLQDEASYKMVSKLIGDVTPKFIESNIYDYEFKETYDNIFLSNLADWDFRGIEFNKLSIRLSKILNIDGQMLLAYVYNVKDYEEECKWMKFVYEKGKVKNALNGFEVSQKYFTGISGLIHRSEAEHDMALLIKRRNY